MGVVYAAYDDQLDRKIAIKLVRADRVDDLTRARVVREAQAMARLSHPNVVGIYEVGEHGTQVYVAMEFVSGPTLAAWTLAHDAQAQSKGELAWPAILARYVEAGRGLAAAHAAGLVHRDFKPANAIVGDDGRVRVLDFGIATQIAGGLPRLRPVPESRTNQSTTLTQTGAMVGTPAYMSLEQFENGNVDARSDQFGFCVALWEALHGERPFAGRTPGALILAMREGTVQTGATNRGVPTWLRERVRRGLAAEPEDRWPSMDALLAALTDDPVQRRRVRGRRATLAVLTLVLLGGSLAFARNQMASAERADAQRARALAEEAEARRRELAAQAERDRALDEARANAMRARDTARILAARSLTRDPTLGAALLREVENQQATGWRSAALEILQRPISRNVLAMHDDRVVDVEYSSDGAWLASASFDGKVRLWSTAQLDSGHYYELAHDDRVFDLAFDPSGRSVASSARDQSARVWALPAAPPSRAGQPLEPSHILLGHDAIIWTVRFSPTGDRLVTTSRSGDVWIWPLGLPGADPRPSPIMRRNVGEIAWHAEFSPDGRSVAIAANDGRVWLWDLDHDRARLVVQHQGVAWVVHFSPDGRWLASAAQSGEVHLAPVDPDRPGRASTMLREHTGPVQRLSFAADGRMLASCSHDNSARVWSIDDQGQVHQPARVFAVGNSFGHSPAFSPDGRWLALGGVEPTVRVFELAGGLPLELRGHTSDVFSIRFSPDGTRLATSSFDRSVRVWPTDWSHVERGFASQLQSDDAGQWLIERSADDRVRFWQVADGQLTPRWRTSEPVARDSFMHAWSAAGDWLVLPSGPAPDHDELLGFELDKRIADDQELVPRWRIPRPAGLNVIQIAPEGHWLVGATAKGELLLWHFPEGLSGGPRPVALNRAKPLDDALSVFQIGLADRAMISTSIRGEVRITTLDPDTGLVGESRDFPGVKSGRNNKIVFDPEGRWVVVTALDRSVRVWSFDSLDQPPLSIMLASEVRSSLYDPASKRLLFGCNDGALRSMDPLTGAVEQLARLDGALPNLDIAAHQPWRAYGTPNGELVIEDGPEPLALTLEGGIRRLDFIGDSQFLQVIETLPTIRVLHLGDRLDAEGLLARLRERSDYCPSGEERIRFAGEAPELAGRDCDP